MEKTVEPIKVNITVPQMDMEDADSSTPMLAEKQNSEPKNKKSGSRWMNVFPSHGSDPNEGFDGGKVLDIGWRSFAECFGTFLFVMLGCSAVCGATIIKLEVGIWQMAIVWGLGLAISIYLTVGISGGHLNPAVSLAMALFRREQFPLYYLLPYISAQFVGAFLGGLMTWAIYDPFIERFEILHNVTRGGEGSYMSAAVFGGYYPNPGVFPDADALTEQLVTTSRAFAIEFIGTMILVLVIFVLTSDQHRALGDKKISAPILIGLTLAVLICEYGVITECSLNPARDLGPRLAAFIVGWGKIALPGPRSGFWVYLTAPIAGGLVGGFIAEFCFIKALTHNNRKEDGVKSE